MFVLEHSGLLYSPIYFKVRLQTPAHAAVSERKILQSDRWQKFVRICGLLWLVFLFKTFVKLVKVVGGLLQKLSGKKEKNKGISCSCCLLSEVDFSLVAKCIFGFHYLRYRF